jgi:hypothetical protein
VKYKASDILLVKDINIFPRLRPHPHLRLHPRPHNTIGIITEVEKHSDIFESGSNENDNGYIWYSQVDGREYYFFENEVVGEVIK